jgi:hypothetical protein
MARYYSFLAIRGAYSELIAIGPKLMQIYDINPVRYEKYDVI